MSGTILSTQKDTEGKKYRKGGHSYPAEKAQIIYEKPDGFLTFLARKRLHEEKTTRRN